MSLTPKGPRLDELTATDVALRDGARTGVRVFAVWNGGSCSLTLRQGTTVTIGRAPDCLLRIEHSSVSRVHARLTLGERVQVEDLGSSNGTWVGGRRLASGELVELPADALLEVGSVLLAVQRSSNDAAVLEASSTDPMAAVFELVEMVAKSRISVILLGETGVGKGHIATQIHARSPRASMPLVSINCAAVPELLIESELFGHERGAFTGASETKRGLLEAADSGTLFLDEVSELSPATQAKLLRVLETGEVMRVGGTRPRNIDVRYIAATNRDLARSMREGLFREDLFFRLDGFTITIPPLRDRRGEIRALAKTFLEEALRELPERTLALAEDAMARLEQYAWPGNLRELRNVIFRSALLGEGSHLGAGDLRFMEEPSSDVSPGRGEPSERERILEALERCAGNQTRAAEVLGVSRRTLIHRLDAYGIARPRKGR